MSFQKFDQGLILDVRKMFVMALAFGVIGVCVPQYFNQPLFAVVLALLCMMIYAWLGYLYSVESAFIEQFADSVYYLGFLLTLVALVVSLYFYQSDSLEASLLTANFSLALITTIFGLAVRIFINNFQLDLNSIERQMMREVEHAANEMIRKAKLISMQLEVSHTETQVAIKKSMNDAIEAMRGTSLMVDQYAQTRSEELLKNTRLTTETIESAVQAFTENIRKMKLPEEIFVEKLNLPLQHLSKRIDETQQLIQHLNDGQGKISLSTQGIVDSMDRSSAEAGILAQSISVLNDKLYAHTKLNDDFVHVVKEVALLAEKTSGISENLQQQADQSISAMQNFSKMVVAVKTLPDDIDTLSHSLKQSSVQVTEMFQALGDKTESGSKIANDLQLIAESLTSTRVLVEKISDFGIHVTSTVKRLETFSSLMERHTELMADMGGVAQLDIDLAKQHQQEMQGILRQSRQALAQMQRDSIGLK